MMPAMRVRSCNGGSGYQVDGVFFINSQITFGNITDGTSNTAMFSESLLGTGPEISSDASKMERPRRLQVCRSCCSPMCLRGGQSIQQQQPSRLRLDQRRVPL